MSISVVGKPASRPRAVARRAELLSLLHAIRDGRVPAEDVVDRLAEPFDDAIDWAKIDLGRERRVGFPEIVYGPGKSVARTIAIVERLLAGNEGPVLVTRAGRAQRAAVVRLALDAGLSVIDDAEARAVGIERGVVPSGGRVAVITGGTADLPVAREAALTARLMGADVGLEPDVGVAGLHRLVNVLPRLADADAVIAVAGMEGALASAVSGLLASPVIACPTSVGYGASFGGLAALLTMLTSCAPGVACVNIDDGLGAGFIAGQIARAAGRGR